MRKDFSGIREHAKHTRNAGGRRFVNKANRRVAKRELALALDGRGEQHDAMLAAEKAFALESDLEYGEPFVQRKHLLYVATRNHQTGVIGPRIYVDSFDSEEGAERYYAAHSRDRSWDACYIIAEWDD